MTQDADLPELHRIGLEPEDLDGHTIDELVDYLDAGRMPPNASIEASPGCVLALDALQRLRTLAPALLEADPSGADDADEGWVQTILTGITLDARAGRRIPVSGGSGGGDLGITEGALRGVIRAAESAVPGVLIGRCRVHGDLEDPHAQIRIQVDASVPYGQPIPDLAERLRTTIMDRVLAQSELQLAGVDIRVHDVRKLPWATEGER